MEDQSKNNVVVIEDDDCDIIVDSPAEVYGSLSEAYASIRSNQEAIRDAYAAIRSNQDCVREALKSIKASQSAIREARASIQVNTKAMRSVSQSMSESVRKVYECTKPITIDVNKSALAGMVSGLTKFAEASKAVTASINTQGMATALSKIGQSFAMSEKLAESLRSSSALLAGDAVRNAINATSCAVPDCSKLGMTSAANNMCKAISSNLNTAEIVKPATTALSTLAAAVVPRQNLLDSIQGALSRFAIAGTKIAEWIKTSPLIEAATTALNRLREYLQINIAPVFEKLRGMKFSLRSYGRWILLYLRKKWLARRGKPYPLDDRSFKLVLLSIPIGPEAPVEYVDFSDRIRHIYLQKHQRISDDTDDVNNIILAAA